MLNENKNLYKDKLLQHFKQPKNKHSAPFDAHMLTARGSNPRCGDDIELGVSLAHINGIKHIEHVGFRGRACSICIASASMMTEVVSNLTCQEALKLANTMQAWIKDTSIDERHIPELLQPLLAVRGHPARHKCVLLAWNALASALSIDAPKLTTAE
ncbi:Fe-S cluster assembly sulfur transfer protein SufU [Ningiella sp. W23]|uniref:Fe-S cluster assembly sulfur transfer protein SufU n=1 Tax=Ningiella sp. W23 TaxID=3023715 RepID=UPI0037571F95